MTTISRTDPTAEAVKNMLPPDQPGIAYVMKRYIVEDLRRVVPTLSPSRTLRALIASSPT